MTEVSRTKIFPDDLLFFLGIVCCSADSESNYFKDTKPLLRKSADTVNIRTGGIGVLLQCREKIMELLPGKIARFSTNRLLDGVKKQEGATIFS